MYGFQKMSNGVHGSCKCYASTKFVSGNEQQNDLITDSWFSQVYKHTDIASTSAEAGAV